MNAVSLESIELGVATSATQIEGGDVGTIWHRWADSGAAVDHSTPAVGCDHWNRVEDDTALLASLGVRHYRMGLEWARIEPAPNAFDDAAIARIFGPALVSNHAGRWYLLMLSEHVEAHRLLAPDAFRAAGRAIVRRADAAPDRRAP